MKERLSSAGLLAPVDPALRVRRVSILVAGAALRIERREGNSGKARVRTGIVDRNRPTASTLQYTPALTDQTWAGACKALARLDAADLQSYPTSLVRIVAGTDEVRCRLVVVHERRRRASQAGLSFSPSSDSFRSLRSDRIFFVSSAAAWIDEHADRRASHQFARMEATKLVTTFGSGVAAAFVAAAMQKSGGTLSSAVSVALLSISIVLVLVVFVMGQLSEPDAERIETACAAAGLPDAATLVLLRAGLSSAVESNRDIVRFVTAAAAVQILFSAVSVAMATWSMWPSQ